MPGNRVSDIIYDKIGTMTDAEKRIAEVLLADDYRAAFYNISDLARAADVSEATVVRFAKTMGYQGFRGLQIQLQEELQETLQRNLTEKHNATRTHDVGCSFLDNLVDKEIECLRTSYGTLTFEQFQRVVRGLATAPKVYITAARSSGPLALITSAQLNLIRPNVTALVYHSDNILQYLSDISDKDVLLAFAFARYSPQTLMIMEEARDTGCDVYCITDSPLAPPTSLATEVLVVNRSSAHFLASNTAALSLSYALVGAVGNLLGDKMKTRIEKMEKLNQRTIRALWHRPQDYLL